MAKRKRGGGGVFLKRGVDTLMYTPKLHALLHKTCIRVIKVLRLDMCTSMITLTKNVVRSPTQLKKQNEQWQVGVGNNREGQNLKKGK